MPIKKIIVLAFLFVTVGAAHAQNVKGLVSGPWAGNIELRNATIWVEVTREVKKVAVKYFANGTTNAGKTVEFKGELGKDFNPVKIELNGLNVNTSYTYEIFIDSKKAIPGYSTRFTTKDLWQWRKPAPDFSFLTGSCAYFNEPEYDRPGKPYGGDSSIFEIMAKTPASFHVWLGDNWYTREVDYSTAWGLNYRASHDRSFRVLQKFWASMPHYAIWDDHDFGPNDSNGSFILKEESRTTFMNYWLNPSYGQEGKGIYTRFSYSDVDFFLLDDRYFRSADNLPDSINEQPNTGKIMFGDQQMQWLENSLATSSASFKIIITGSQVLNPLSPYDCLKHFPVDYKALLTMLERNNISGALFFTGDRHHSEIIKHTREANYTLYDITVSPYTSGAGTFYGVEKNNPARILGIDGKQNFGKVTISGKKGDRVLTVEFIGVKGDSLGQWSVKQKDLNNKGK